MRGRLGKVDIINTSLQIERHDVAHDGKVLVVNGESGLGSGNVRDRQSAENEGDNNNSVHKCQVRHAKPTKPRMNLKWRYDSELFAPCRLNNLTSLRSALAIH